MKKFYVLIFLQSIFFSVAHSMDTNSFTMQDLVNLPYFTSDDPVNFDNDYQIRDYFIQKIHSDTNYVMDGIAFMYTYIKRFLNHEFSTHHIVSHTLDSKLALKTASILYDINCEVLEQLQDMYVEKALFDEIGYQYFTRSNTALLDLKFYVKPEVKDACDVWNKLAPRIVFRDLIQREVPSFYVANINSIENEGVELDDDSFVKQLTIQDDNVQKDCIYCKGWKKIFLGKKLHLDENNTITNEEIKVLPLFYNFFKKSNLLDEIIFKYNEKYQKICRILSCPVSDGYRNFFVIYDCNNDKIERMFLTFPQPIKQVSFIGSGNKLLLKFLLDNSYIVVDIDSHKKIEKNLSKQFAISRDLNFFAYLSGNKIKIRQCDSLKLLCQVRHGYGFFDSFNIEDIVHFYYCEGSEELQQIKIYCKNKQVSIQVQKSDNYLDNLNEKQIAKLFFFIKGFDVKGFE